MKLPQLLTEAKREGWANMIRSEADERAVLEGCWYDKRQAEQVCKFFPAVLRYTKDVGEFKRGDPFQLLDWQAEDVIKPLFGWKLSRDEGAPRRFTKGDIFVAKKNGKSSVLAAIACMFLYAAGHRTEIYGAAHSREQAGIIYREAAAMASASPKLSKLVKPLDATKRIVRGDTNSFYCALAGENGAKSAEGLIPDLILFDEIHVQRDRKFYDALVYAGIANDKALMLSGSTVGVADETSIWWEQYDYCKRMLKGEIVDFRRFAYVAQADEACKESKELRASEEQWRKANPSLGKTVSIEKFRAAVQEAENSPAKLNSLLRYLFNIPTAQTERVIDVEALRELRGEMPDLSGRICYGGLDVASREDLTSFVLYFPPDGDEPGAVLVWCWCPRLKIEERKLQRQEHYSLWERDGHLIICGESTIDHKQIVRTILECSEQYDLREIGADRWNADFIRGELEDASIDFVEIPQTLVGMNSPCAAFLNAIQESSFIHEGNPVFEWACGNVAGEFKADCMKFSKSDSAGKIDPAVAAAMAFGRAVVNESDSSSVYDDGESLVL